MMKIIKIIKKIINKLDKWIKSKLVITDVNTKIRKTDKIIDIWFIPKSENSLLYPNFYKYIQKQIKEIYIKENINNYQIINCNVDLSLYKYDTTLNQTKTVKLYKTDIFYENDLNTIHNDLTIFFNNILEEYDNCLIKIIKFQFINVNNFKNEEKI